MEASFDGMRRNATANMNELYRVLEEVIGRVGALCDICFHAIHALTAGEFYPKLLKR